MTNNPDDRFDWKRYEAEVSEPEMVDSSNAQGRPALTLARLRAAKRRPIVPVWLRSWRELRSTAGWALRFTVHTSLYHVTRSPKYAVRLLARTPRGLTRTLGGFVRWLFDLEGEPVRQATVRTEDAEAYLRLSRQRDRRVRWRGMVGVFVLGALAVAIVTVALAPNWAQWTAGIIMLVLLGAIGRPADKPLLDTAVVVPRAARLTSDVVVRALSVLGIAGIGQALAKDPRAIAFPAPITRDGPGWRADIDLPYGITASEVIERREKLAAGLSRPLGCVWPEGNAEVHPGRLVLWVGDEDMSKTKRAAWPLARGGPVDVFRPQPLGTDQRGRWVSLPLMFVAMVIGSIPRMGKTFALRLALLIASLDPRAEIHAYDLKGTGDLSPLEHVAHRYRAGEEFEDIEYAVAAMRDLRDELRRRAKVIRDLPRDLCPENKVTPELAGKKSLGLHPIVVGVDECQVWFEHPEYGKEFEAICTDLVKRGPAVGMVLIVATQRPDAKSLPTGISANASIRFCLKVMGQTENDMVLGTSRYRNGVRATMFAWADKGVGYLVGEEADARIVRTAYVDAVAAERVAVRARGLRGAAGTLSGHALGERAEPSAIARYDLLEDLLAVVPESETKVWNETVVSRLAELRPDTYGAWESEQLTFALKPHRIRVRQVWSTDPASGRGANRRGIVRAHIVEAVTDRDRRREAN